LGRPFGLDASDALGTQIKLPLDSLDTRLQRPKFIRIRRGNRHHAAYRLLNQTQAKIKVVESIT